MISAKYICPNCNKNDQNEFKNITELNVNNSAKKCDKCKLVLQSLFKKEKYLNKDEVENDEWFELPKMSSYFHINDSIDYDMNRLHENELKCKFSEKRALLVGYNSVESAPVLHSLRKLNFKLFVSLSIERDLTNDYTDDWICAEEYDMSHKEETLKKVNDYCLAKNIKFDIIFTIWDYTLFMTNYLQIELGLEKYAIPTDFLISVRNKYKFRQLCKQLDISPNNHFLLDFNSLSFYLNYYEANNLNEFVVHELNINNDEIKLLKNNCKYPIIVKHALGCGKDYIRKCNNRKDFCNCLKEIQTEFSSIDTEKINCVVEEYFDGHEIDMDILIQNNELKFIAISDNLPQVEPWFLEVASICPSIYLTIEEKNAIKRIVEKWISKMNFQNALIYFEARCRPKSLYKNSYYDLNKNDHQQSYEDWLVENEKWFLMPIEINSRLCGGEGLLMHAAAYDVNFIHEYMRICLGIELDTDLLNKKRDSPRFICYSKSIQPFKSYEIDSLKLKCKSIIKNENLIELNFSKTTGMSGRYNDMIGYLMFKLDYNKELNGHKEKVNNFIEFIINEEEKSYLNLIQLDFKK